MNVLRVAAGVTGLFLAAAACTTTDSSPEPQQPVKVTAVKWSNCGDGLQCGKVDVPLDYGKPDGDKISLAVNRMPATGKNKIGSLLVNPGGPGASGLDLVRDSGKLFGADVRASFDLVGFDPRGVGESRPVRCLTGPQLDTFYGTDTSPDDLAEQKALDDVSRQFSAGCEKNSATVLPYVGTRNAARDMDAIRAAVGDEKLTYYGASYGTYLGAWYAEQFPRNIRALVLDGAVDPALSAADINIEQAKGFETALASYAASCVRKPTCPLGTGTVDAALAKVSELLATADRKPLKNTMDSREIGENEVAMGIALPLYDRNGWDALSQGLTQAFNGDGTILLRFADLMTERQPDGTYKNQSEANMAVNCVDKPNPDLAGFKAEAEKAERAAPHFGEFIVWGTLPCASWPVKPDSDPKPLKAVGAPPIVVVGTTRDPATPYQWAKNLASQLDSGVLLSYDGDGHTAYLQGPPCIRTAVDTYLIKTTPPSDGTTC
ncbi:alpha/beta hydrolase [Actinocorallia longicatena]|uniref:Alpha/beta hydrolase n=1 Tax=Actinocorallia longicatena TaxID=111803 RepID=A0ABP6QL99_9ACTN